MNTSIPAGTTHKNPLLNRFGTTCFDWFRIDPETGDIFQWYTPYRENVARWAPPLAQMVTKEYWHKTLIPVEQELTLEPKARHCQSPVTGQNYDRPENPYYPSSKGYQGD